MYDDDYLLDEDDGLAASYYEEPEDDSKEEEDEDIDFEDEGEDIEVDNSNYEGKMTKREIDMSTFYDNISASSRKNKNRVSFDSGIFDGNLVDAVTNVLNAIPANTSSATVTFMTNEVFNTQSHNRIPSSVYVPDKPLSASDLPEEFGGTGDNGFNEEFARAAREHIAKFVEYLANRDLSKDSITSKRRKQRQLPAFIIFLFSSNLYDLILNCPTMPEEYDKQINAAFSKIQDLQYEIVEQLAQRYESKGRQKVADRVRKMGLEWFDKKNEPAEIRNRAGYADLELTYEDIQDYREFRPKFTNASRSITQELISEFIEVVIEPGKIYENLGEKTKTRALAIEDVKQVYKEWSEENPIDSSFANKIIWKDLRVN